MRSYFFGCRLHRFVVFLQVLFLLVPVSTSFAQADRASRMRETASRWLTGSADFVEDLLPGEDIDSALLDPVGGGMRDLEQTLGEAVFAVPVAGNVGYVLRPQIYHDLPIIFPPNWNPVSVIIADESRWAHARQGSVILVQPGEVGARTNMTLVFDTGELLQLDLEEVTGAFGRLRTGRVYIGPQSWLVERIFALMPLRRAGPHGGPHPGRRSQGFPTALDPIAVIREHGDFDALPPADDDRWRRVREQAQAVARLQRDVPAPPPPPEPEVVPEVVVEPPPPRFPMRASFRCPPWTSGQRPERLLTARTWMSRRMGSDRAVGCRRVFLLGMVRSDRFHRLWDLVRSRKPVPGRRRPVFPTSSCRTARAVCRLGPPPGGSVPLPPYFDPAVSTGATLMESGWAQGGARLMTASLLPGDTLPADFFLPGPGRRARMLLLGPVLVPRLSARLPGALPGVSFRPLAAALGLCQRMLWRR